MKYTRDRVYRKIYEDAYGLIPKDSRGITFDIHHKDGDKTNNSLENLVALSVEDHYKLHLSQEDWGEASMLAQRLGISKEEWAVLRSRATTQQWANRSAEERARVIAKGVDSQTPEQRSEKSRKGRETLRANGQFESVGLKIAASLAKIPAEQRSENAKRGWETRRLKCPKNNK